ncbi:hypothetical protein, partial [Pseudotamlana agarivorans]|uniref:hypothetical protein n=1 Tax=Pseudotamlana agarivorans TaxID=481183 RepID=UPI001B805118
GFFEIHTFHWQTQPIETKPRFMVLLESHNFNINEKIKKTNRIVGLIFCPSRCKKGRARG